MIKEFQGEALGNSFIFNIKEIESSIEKLLEKISLLEAVKQ